MGGERGEGAVTINNVSILISDYIIIIAGWRQNIRTIISVSQILNVWPVVKLS